MDARDGTGPTVPAAGVAILDRSMERLLLGRHVHDGAWATFGGRVDGMETAEECARREVREELGTELDRLDLLGLFGGTPQYTVHYPGWGSTSYSVTMFIGSLPDDQVLTVDRRELVDVRWFTRAELPSARLADDMFQIIPAAMDWAERKRAAH